MALLQTSFFPQFIITAVKPDLILLFVLSVGLLKGYREAVAVGIVSGFIVGIISWNIWGFYILAYALAGFGAGLVPEKVEPDNIVIPLVTGIIGSIAYEIVFSSLGILTDLFYFSGEDFYKILIFLIWNTVLALPVFYLCKYVLVPPGLPIDIEEAEKKSSYLMD